MTSSLPRTGSDDEQNHHDDDSNDEGEDGDRAGAHGASEPVRINWATLPRSLIAPPIPPSGLNGRNRCLPATSSAIRVLPDRRTFPAQTPHGAACPQRHLEKLAWNSGPPSARREMVRATGNLPELSRTQTSPGIHGASRIYERNHSPPQPLTRVRTRVARTQARGAHGGVPDDGSGSAGAAGLKAHVVDDASSAPPDPASSEGVARLRRCRP